MKLKKKLTRRWRLKKLNFTVLFRMPKFDFDQNMQNTFDSDRITCLRTDTQADAKNAVFKKRV